MAFNSTSSYRFPKNEDSPFGISAARDDIHLERDLSLPLPQKDGKFPTLNQTGFMTPDQNPYTEDFIAFAATCSLPVLDVGAAYGIATLPALKGGATVIANDIEEKHLLLLREQTTVEERNRLFLNTQMFPHTMNFPDNSLGAILVCRLAHFLTEEEIEIGIAQLKRWLAPKGRLYMITTSPHHHLLPDFFPRYLKQSQEGVAWPGAIPDMHKIAPELSQHLPKFLHVMDAHSLGKALQRHGFRMVREGLFDYMRPQAKKSGGKGHYGVLVEKTETQ